MTDELLFNRVGVPTPSRRHKDGSANTDAPAFYRETRIMELTVSFDKGYIAHPYWPACARLIDVQKESGTNRARTETNRAKALSDHLAKVNVTMDQYEALQSRALRPFYTAADVQESDAIPLGEHNADEIVIRDPAASNLWYVGQHA